MSENKEDLIKEGLELLENALCRFNGIKDCENSTWVSNALYHVIQVISSLYILEKK